MSRWPVLDGVARRHLAAAPLVGRRVRLDGPADEATEHVVALLTAAGALVVTDASADVLVGDEVVAGERVVGVPVLDPTGDAHGLIRAVLRHTNRRLPGTRVAVVGFDPARRELARVLRALGGLVTVVDEDPLHRLAALTDGHDIGTSADAEIVLAAEASDVPDVPGLPDGAVVAGPHPAAVGTVVDEPRPGLCRVRRAGVEVFVLDPVALGGGRAAPWLDLMWATRLVTLAWVAATPDGRRLPVELQRELAAAVLDARGVR